MRYAVIALTLAGCAAVERPAAEAPRPGESLTQGQLAGRLRQQVAVAVEAYYRDDWDLLSRAARDMASTASLLDPERLPPARRDDSAKAKATILSDAPELSAAADGRDVPRVNELLRRLHVESRRLPPE
jgi:hypothetical protein